MNLETATETWSSLIYARFKTEIDRLVNMCRACVRNADTRVIEIVSERVNSALFQGSPMAPLLGRFEDFVRAHVSSILATVPTNRASIEEFIVYKSSSTDDTQSQSRLSTAAAEEESTRSATKASGEMMEVDSDNQSIDSNQFDSVSSTLSGNSMDVDQHFNEARKRQGKDLEAGGRTGGHFQFLVKINFFE